MLLYQTSAAVVRDSGTGTLEPEVWWICPSAVPRPWAVCSVPWGRAQVLLWRRLARAGSFSSPKR